MADNDKKRPACGPKTVYALGQRDVLAGLFALVRSEGVDAALLRLAKEYKEKFGENPHVQRFLDGR